MPPHPHQAHHLCVELEKGLANGQLHAVDIRRRKSGQLGAQPCVQLVLQELRDVGPKVPIEDGEEARRRRNLLCRDAISEPFRDDCVPVFLFRSAALHGCNLALELEAGVEEQRRVERGLGGDVDGLV